MFGLLRRWFAYLNVVRLFRRRTREIFDYWDGHQHRQADPLSVWRQIWEDPDCAPDRDFCAACGIDERGNNVNYDPEAQDRVLAMVRKVFGLKPWTERGGGLTVNETFELLWRYMFWMECLKKKRDLLLMQRARSASISSTQESSTTPPESESSSTSQESKSEEPPSSSKRSIQL